MTRLIQFCVDGVLWVLIFSIIYRMLDVVVGRLFGHSCKQKGSHTWMEIRQFRCRSCGQVGTTTYPKIEPDMSTQLDTLNPADEPMTQLHLHRGH